MTANSTSIFLSLILLIVWPSLGHAAELEKYALLIGVDDQLSKPNSVVPVLQGPGNDVKLMRELLVKQYDFKDDLSHIRVLTGKAATTKAIRDAFQAHLIANARENKNAIIVFYFSGHGSITKDLGTDEGDGIDETLVAYDSRGEGGKDIIDDEVQDWFDALQSHTSNVTFILDSCHSGTATRVSGIFPRELPPHPDMPAPLARKTLDSDGTPSLLRNQKYTAIAGALANELSYEGNITEAGGIRYGYLTWHLVQTLSLRPYLSWRQTLVEVRRGVAKHAPRQHPQVEGDIDRIAFGGIGDRAQPFVPIVKIDPNNTLSVAAGAAQGVAVGTILAIYDPKARVLTGDHLMLATARVTSVGVGVSRAELLNKPAQPLTSDAKVTIVTPYFGTEPLAIKLDKLAGQTTRSVDAKLLADVQKSLAQSSLVKPASGAQKWRFAVQRGCLGAKGELSIPDSPDPPAGCAQAYYLTTPQTREATLAFWVPASDSMAVTKLADAISALARQASLRELDNKQSLLNVVLRLVYLKVEENSARELEIVDKTVLPDSRLGTVKIADYYTFEIDNQSDKDVYIALLVLGTSGSIQIMSPSANGELVKAKSKMTMSPPLTAGPPTGLETYKIIATTRSDVDFSVMSAPGASKRAAASPLEWYLAQAGSTKSRDSAAATNVDFNEWTTAQLDIQVRPKAPAAGK